MNSKPTVKVIVHHTKKHVSFFLPLNTKDDVLMNVGKQTADFNSIFFFTWKSLATVTVLLPTFSHYFGQKTETHAG